ncbi:MAG: hypothetical protein KDF54_04330 [Hydrogenophaga sp.]|nr:hypothetical protein [Hydrogenophaga sp.]
MIRALFSTLALCALAACASSEQVWQKSGVSDFDTANYLSECRFQTGLAKIKGERAEELVKYCMQAKGFRLQ